MKRGLSTLLLVVVALALGGYIYFVEWKKPATSDTREKAFAGVDAGTIEQITVKNANGDTTTLERQEGTWQITAPSAMEADATEASAIASALAGLEITRVVDEKPADVAQYGLQPPKVEVSFTIEGDAAAHTLQVGEKTPTSGDVYARRDVDPKVFLVSSFNDQVFNKTTFDLRNKAVLKFDRDKATGVDIVNGADTVKLQRQEQNWQVVSPLKARGDYAAAEGLVTRLSTAQMSKLVTAEASQADLASYGLDKPSTLVTVHTGGGSATLAVGKPEGDGAFARDTARPMVFTIDTTLLTDLRKGADDYRRKEVFEFRPFNAERLQISRGGQTMLFEKAKGTGDQGDTWRRDGKPLDQAKMDDLLMKLADVRATGFAGPAADAGMKSPALVVDVTFDGRKTEHVTLAKVGEAGYAARSDEAGAATVDGAAIDGVLQALDATAAQPTATTTKP